MCNSLRGMILNISEKSKEVGASSQEVAATHRKKCRRPRRKLASAMQHVADGATKTGTGYSRNCKFAIRIKQQ